MPDLSVGRLRAGLLVYGQASAAEVLQWREGLAGAGLTVITIGNGPTTLDDGARLTLDVRVPGAGAFDVIAVPGGPGAVEALRQTELLTFLRRQRRHVALVLASNEGVIPVAAAGWLRHRRVAAAVDLHEPLAKAGFVTPMDDAIVADGPVLTAHGEAAVGLLLARLGQELRDSR